VNGSLQPWRCDCWLGGCGCSKTKKLHLGDEDRCDDCGATRPTIEAATDPLAELADLLEQARGEGSRHALRAIFVPATLDLIAGLVDAELARRG
jgi:hypothetical protein